MNEGEQYESKDMAVLTTDDIIAATGGELICGDARFFTGVCIDSRKIRDGELFVALKGERFDGHDFCDQALEKGSGAVVQSLHAVPAAGKTIVRVKDTLHALQDIARFVRKRADVPVVAITGSNGKTTTKELIAAVLGTQYRILKTTGNLNNHIGLPLSLAKITDEERIIVLEMGASGPGDISELCSIALPDYGVLTNINRAHLEGFKDMETVRRTKLELLETLKVAVVNADDLFLMEGIQRSKFAGSVIRYGIENPADVRAVNIVLREQGSEFQIHFGEGRSLTVSPQIAGRFNISNILAAASVGHLFDIDPLNIKQAIDSFSGVPMRMEYREISGIRIISDMYNANPGSMEAALTELARIKKGRAIAVLGDMLELGSFEEEAHRELGRFLSKLSIDIFIAVGPCMSVAASEFNGTVYPLSRAEDAGKVLRNVWQTGDAVLIKGSRGMRMEKVLEG